MIILLIPSKVFRHAVPMPTQMNPANITAYPIALANLGFILFISGPSYPFYYYINYIIYHPNVKPC